MSTFRRLGIQKRIMLYVTVGLLVMFGSFIFVGLRAIDEARDLVFEERLATTHATAGLLERDFLHVARDVEEFSPELTEANPLRDSATNRLLTHLSGADRFPFFRVVGVWVLDPSGRLLTMTGSPNVTSHSETAAQALAAMRSSNTFTILPAPQSSMPGVPFVTIVVRAAGASGARGLVVAVHTVSINSANAYVPGDFWETRSGNRQPETQATDRQSNFHLEVVSPQGMTVLGIGEDERAGSPSSHFRVIQSLMTEDQAATLLHSPGPDEDFESHVLAAVPLGSSKFYVVLEQSADVALALPIRLRRELFAVTIVGFLAVLMVAWITTRHVVMPTVQLTAAAQRMAEGNLESPIGVTAQDEVGKLAENLDAMRQQLRLAYRQVEQTNQELESQVMERTARLDEVLAKLISAQEEERRRLARELHDEMAQTLSALSIALDRIRDGLRDDPRQAVEQLTEAKMIASQLLEETRRLILDLRPAALDDLGLGPAIRWYVETHLEEQGISATVEVAQPISRLSKHLEASLFRVIQEAVNNIIKHANAAHVIVRLTFEDSVAHVVVADDGRGFDAERALTLDGRSGENIGIIGMQERVRLLGGRLRIRSQPGQGTQVEITIPASREVA